MLQPLPPGLRFAGLLALGLTYATVSIRTQPPGLVRLLLSLPLFLLFSMGPLEFKQSVVASGSLGFMFGWLCNFKLLAFSANRGSLALPGISPAQWLLMLLLPYFPAKRGHARARAGNLLLSLVAKLGGAAALTLALVSPAAAAYPWLVHTGYALYVWLLASLMLDVPAPLGLALLSGSGTGSGSGYRGLDLQPAMDAPYAATSVREFWGRRYNQIVSVVLQETIYRPVVEGRWIAASPPSARRGSANSASDELTPSTRNGSATGNPASDGSLEHNLRRRAPALADGAATEPPTAAAAGKAAAPAEAQADAEPLRVSPRRRLAALFAAFAASGLMHEVCIMYMCDGRLEGSFRMLSFFMVQPLLMVGQEAATAALARLFGRRTPGVQPKKGGVARGLGGLVLRLVQTAVTLGLVLWSAEWLFWGPFETCRIDQRGLAEAVEAIRAVQGWVQGLMR